MHLAQAVDILKRQCSVIKKIQLKYSDQVNTVKEGVVVLFLIFVQYSVPKEFIIVFMVVEVGEGGGEGGLWCKELF